MLLSIYRVYNKRVYKGKQRKGKKVAGKVSAGKSVPLSVYRYSIIEIRERKSGKRAGKGMFIIYRYIERFFL